MVKNIGYHLMGVTRFARLRPGSDDPRAGPVPGPPLLQMAYGPMPGDGPVPPTLGRFHGRALGSQALHREECPLHR